jgi:type I restriction enzyme S subunit
MSQTQKVKRLRFVTTVPPKSEVRLVHDDTEVSFVPMEAIGENGEMQTDRRKRIGEVVNGYTYFGEGDVVLAKITPCFENGKGAIASRLVNRIGFGTTELHVLRAGRDLDSRFLFYVTRSHDFRKLGEAEMYGAGGQKRVPESFVRDFRAYVPSTREQREIADFLDRETVNIEELISLKRELIRAGDEQTSVVIFCVASNRDGHRSAITLQPQMGNGASSKPAVLTVAASTPTKTRRSPLSWNLYLCLR